MQVALLHKPVYTAMGMRQSMMCTAALPASQASSTAEAAAAAAGQAFALAGKDLATKLAADFAQQHRSKQSVVATTAGLIGKHPTSLDVSVALAAAAAEKVLNERALSEQEVNERAVRAKAAAEQHIHEQAVRAKQSVQGMRSSEDVHAARMEALRLRNMARHDSPQAPAVLPAAADQPTNMTAAMPDTQPAAAPAAASGLSAKSQTSEASLADSRLKKKRGRDEDLPPVGQEAALGLPAPPAGPVALLSHRRERAASPASAGSRDSLRRQGHSANSRQV